MTTFNELGIEESILSAINELNFETPMPVQKEVIPHLLSGEGRDIIALAQTGTGKTAAFGLPIIQNTDIFSNKIQYLILSPTRELCLQISDDLVSYAKYKPGVKIAAVFGGASIERQIQKVSKGVQIISATPGRLIDLIERKVVNLSEIKTVVLDEADEMLNMGFREDLEIILKTTPKKKSILLFSATMPQEIAAIASNYMNKPVEITIGKRNAGAENIEHICYLAHAKERYLALKRIVDFYPDIYGIVFCRTRKETQEVADNLIKDGYNADALHGDLSQNQRDFVMNKFRIKNLQLLVATDVAARGLDVDNLSHIINYNLPEENEIYTHRSGRTGRAGRKGISIAIASVKERNKLQDIEKKIGKKFTFAEIPSGKEICEKQLFFLIDRMEKVEVDYSQINPLLPDIFRKLEWLDREELIKKFVSVEFNRFLEYYKNSADLVSPNSSRSSSRKRDGKYSFTRFFINIGQRDGLKPNTLIGMINEYTGIDNIEIGKIELLKNFSFFEIDAQFADILINAFQGREFKNRPINLEVSGKQKGDRNDEDRSFDKRKKGKKDFFGKGNRERRGRDKFGGDSDGRKKEYGRDKFEGEKEGKRKEYGWDKFGGDGERKKKEFGRDKFTGDRDRKRKEHGSDKFTGEREGKKKERGGENWTDRKREKKKERPWTNTEPRKKKKNK